MKQGVVRLRVILSFPRMIKISLNWLIRRKVNENVRLSRPMVLFPVKLAVKTTTTTGSGANLYHLFSIALFWFSDIATLVFQCYYLATSWPHITKDQLQGTFCLEYQSASLPP